MTFYQLCTVIAVVICIIGVVVMQQAVGWSPKFFAYLIYVLVILAIWFFVVGARRG